MNNVKEIRTSKGLQANYVQKQLGVTRQMYYYIETEHIPTRYVKRLCEILKVDRVELLGDEIFDPRFVLSQDEMDRACRIRLGK